MEGEESILLILFFYIMKSQPVFIWRVRDHITIMAETKIIVSTRVYMEGEGS